MPPLPHDPKIAGLLDEIYQSAITPALWESLPARLAAIAGGGAWALQLVRRGGLRGTVVHGVNFDPVASTQRDLIEVTYAGGFVTPQQDADDVSLTRSLPYDIEEAVIVMAAQRYKSKGRDMAVTSRKALKASISYDHQAANMLPQIAREAVARYQWRH